MGLDMYLTKDIYVGAQYKHRKVVAKIDITADGERIEVNPERVSSITEAVGYWRKANAIHGWFVNAVQGGKDDCRRYRVMFEQLLELRDLCKKVLETKDPSLLPPTPGFFFGSTEADDFYYNHLKETVELINGLKMNGEYFYQSSW